MVGRHTRVGVVVAVVGVLLVGWFTGGNCPMSKARHYATAWSAEDHNVLRGHDWTHLAGATADDKGVHVRPLGRAVVGPNGTDEQPNPPVNLRGPHLTVRGDFRLTATLRDVSASPAYLQLYGEVPVLYDEWRQERRSLRLGVVDGHLEVALWDGGSARPKVLARYGGGLRGEVTITLWRQGDRLVFAADGKRLGNLLDNGVFAGGRIWFGADAAGARGFTLSGLRAAGGAVSVVDAPPLAQPRGDAGSLRNVAARRARPLPIGAAVASGPLFTDEAYRRTVARELSVLTPENDMKPQFVHPQPDVYAFTEADALVDFARANDMRVHAHTLVWGEALPAWMRRVPRADRERVMLSHIEHVAGHLKGRVAEWDVVNEPLSVSDDDYGPGRSGLRRTLWLEAMGESYLDKAFHAAHKADPGAALYLNEFGAEADGERWDALYALVTRLKQRGVPIDGVGFQSHIHEKGDHIDPEVLRKHIQALARLGVRSRVSEIDVHGEDAQVQAEQYVAVLRACEQEPTCTTYGTWGVTDRYGSTADPGSYPLEPGDELLWDTNLHPKPAYTAIRTELAR